MLVVLKRYFCNAVATCGVLVAVSTPARAQEADSLLLDLARQRGVTAANATSAWPFAILGIVGGFPIGAAVGDIGTIRVGDEAGYRTRRLLVGGVILIGSSIVARDAYARL